jgi:4-amino-4-deoxy-L-arabinose transferase-like glycosyltransferase
MSEPKSGLRRLLGADLFPAGILAALNLGLAFAAINRFGWFRDELYYIACSDHLAFGYVDHPPLSILVLKLVRTLFGDSLFAIRLLPAVGSAAFVLLAALIARELGGKKRAATLAAASAFATANYFNLHIYSMNFWDILVWSGILLVLVRLVRTDNPRLWPAVGLLIGLGFQNKIGIIFLCFGIAAGVLLTPLRAHLKSRHLWIGAGIAALLFLPYILWNAGHGWAHLEFLRNAAAEKNTPVTPLGFLVGQVVYQNPLNILVWVPGLGFFFRRAGRSMRFFGWAFAAMFLSMMVMQGKDYYLSPAYPILFAGGALLWESLRPEKASRALTSVLTGLIVVLGLLVRPIVLPILSVERTQAFLKALDLPNTAAERNAIGPLPQHLADMFGWEESVALYAEILGRLGPEDRMRADIYVRNYGEAAAIDFLGRKYGLPKAMCTHNSYWIWGPPEGKTGELMIVLGNYHDLQRSFDDISPHFESIEHVATFKHPLAMPYENDRPIFLCRGLKITLAELYKRDKHFI